MSIIKLSIDKLAKKLTKGLKESVWIGAKIELCVIAGNNYATASYETAEGYETRLGPSNYIVANSPKEQIYTIKGIEFRHDTKVEYHDGKESNNADSKNKKPYFIIPITQDKSAYIKISNIGEITL